MEIPAKTLKAKMIVAMAKKMTIMKVTLIIQATVMMKVEVEVVAQKRMNTVEVKVLMIKIKLRKSLRFKIVKF